MVLGIKREPYPCPGPIHPSPTTSPHLHLSHSQVFKWLFSFASDKTWGCLSL